MKIKSLSSLLSCVMALNLSAVSLAYAQENSEIEFSSAFLRSEKNETRLDTSRFRHANAIMAGEYPADVYVNGKRKGGLILRFKDDENQQPQLCLTPQLLELFDLRVQAYAGGKMPLSTACVSLDKLLSQGTARFDVSALQLNLELPQAFIIPRPEGYIPPSQWQTGVNAMYINYNLDHYQYHLAGKQHQNTYLGLRGAVNLGGWALHHQGSMDWQKREDGRVESNYYRGDTYLQRDIPALRSQFYLGDIHSQGSLMESVSLRGASIVSDSRMLPQTLRGYAPIVRGIANSNALITIRQNGRVTYQISVPAGPFVIDDLHATGYSGDLQVEILEADGSRREFTVPFANVAQLVRPNQWHYQLAAGRYRQGNQLTYADVVQGTLQYGFKNNLTLNGGMNWSRDYTAGLLGLALNTPIGAFSSDVTYSYASLFNEPERKKGYSLHANYSVNLPTKTNLTLAAYRYSSRDYHSLSNTILSHERGNQEGYVSEMGLRPKNQFRISVNQRLGDNGGVLYLTGMSHKYWESEKMRHEYQLSYSNSFNRVNYNVGYAQARTENNLTDRRFYVSLSLPLGEGHRTPTVSQSINVARNSQISHASLHGSLGQEGQIDYGLSSGVSFDGNYTLSANAGYRSSLALFRASASADNHSNRQASFGMSGAIVAHPKGITATSSQVSDSFAIIHAKGASGAKIVGAGGHKLDYFGNGIVSHLSPYEVNNIAVETESLPLNLELKSTQEEVIPRANGAMLVDFSGKEKSMVLFNVRLEDGKTPAMASEAFDQDENLIGYVGQGGRLFASELTKKEGQINVVWGENKADRCEFDYSLPDLNNKDVQEIKQYSATCRVAQEEQ